VTALPPVATEDAVTTVCRDEGSARPRAAAPPAGLGNPAQV